MGEDKNQVSLPREDLEKIRHLIDHYPERRAAIGDVLYMAQKHFGHLSPDVERHIAEVLELPVTYVHQVVTFYNMYLEEPVGKYLIMLCDNVSCTICGAGDLAEHIGGKLGIGPGETTGDKKFTLWLVECLGACELAPMMLVNDKQYGNLTTEKLDSILDSLE